MSESKKTMTVREFAKEWGIGTNKAYEFVHIKGFPKITIGKKIIIIADKVDEFMHECIGKKFEM